MAAVTVDDVTKLVAALLEDQAQDQITNDYALPWLKLAYWDVYAKLLNINFPFAELDQELTPYAAGTTNLDAFKASGQPLEFMLGRPRSIEWKLVGAPDTDYLPVEDVRKLDHIDQTQGIAQWTWKSSSVKTTPSTVDVTLLVVFQSLWVDFTSADDQVALPGTHQIIAYFAAAKIAALGNQPTVAANCNKWGSEAIESLEDYFTKQSQRLVLRTGRSSGRGRRVGGWPRLQS